MNETLSISMEDELGFVVLTTKASHSRNQADTCHRDRLN